MCRVFRYLDTYQLQHGFGDVMPLNEKFFLSDFRTVPGAKVEVR